MEMTVNDISSLSLPFYFSSISEIDHNRLNALSFRLIGCYGNPLMIAELLLNKNVINKQLFDLLTSAEKSKESRNKSNLRPGVYLSIVNPDVGLVIHWPESGCYEENAPSQRKKSMTNLHRYLTKLTDEQLCLMSDKDLEYFEWNSGNDEQDSNDEDDGGNNRYFEFEIKKSQEEQEDFKLARGFEVSFPHNANENVKENKKRTQLCPMIVESVHHQAFITRSIITSPVIMTKCTLQYPRPSNFKNDLDLKLKGRSLKIDRVMSIKGLKFLVKYGLGLGKEFLGPLDSAIEKAKILIDSKQELERKNIEKDAELVREIAKKIVTKILSVKKIKMNDPSNLLDVDESLKQLDERYQGILIKIHNAVQINSDAWKRLKTRYIFLSMLIQKVSSSKKNEIKEKTKGSALEVFYEMFADKEDDPHSYIENAIAYANCKEDPELIKGIRQTTSFDVFNDIRQKFMDEFFREYQKWRKNIFDSNIKRIAPGYTDQGMEFKKKYEEILVESRKIEEQEFEKICLEIEKKFPTGRIFRIIDVTEGVYAVGFRLTYEFETTNPDQLHITIYETSWDQSDSFRLQEDEYHVPKPILSARGNAGISLYVDYDVYDFRKIACFKDKKYLVILWNKKENMTEIFFGKSPKLVTSIQSYPKKCFVTLRTEEFCLFAVNESKGLLGIFNTKSGMLDIFAFDEERKNLFNRNNKIKILQWYDNVIPDIQHFFFIKDTEEICFVEVGGRAKLYNFVNGQFRPSVGKIPENASTVLSTPDGSCIVAFAQESVRVAEDTSSNIDGGLISKEITKEIEVCRAYVYFCSNFGQPANKIIELPSYLDLECLQFSQLYKRQMHLISLDLEKRLFHSLIVKITIERSQYGFQQRSQRKPLGQVKLASPTRNKDCSIIQGNHTHFERDVGVGEGISLLRERYRDIFFSDTMLDISGSFRPGSGNEWVDFRTKPKIKINGYIDAYKFRTTKPLSLRVLLDLPDDNEIEDYQDKFEEYINDMFEENQFSVNSDLSSMFRRFQNGALLLNDQKLFQAKLCIIIKDVPPNDKEDIVREFTQKFNSLVAEEGEDNFISKMYPSGLTILPWTLISDPEWYDHI
ncbi:11333_t:CDS:10 [Acaulospora morrowiae]|uniref:11333_t:CDS:1 n=1 Tax=Acaulospora morrowiae TaxID=94023 RepID=A0A9N9EXH9_9GLOM|nr:11333_t:CDS:10 [Acaulospora morrowiae]